MNNLYNDKEFQEGIFSCADLIKDHFDCQPPILTNFKKGVDFSVTLLQSIYDSLTEEPVEPLSDYEPEGIVY